MANMMKIEKELEFLSELSGKKVTLEQFQSELEKAVNEVNALAALLEKAESEKFYQAATEGVKKYEKALSQGDLRKASAIITQLGDLAGSARYKIARPLSKAVEAAELTGKAKEAAEKALWGMRESLDGLMAAAAERKDTARWVKKFEAQKAEILKYV